jgi:hypothetical protein
MIGVPAPAEHSVLPSVPRESVLFLLYAFIVSGTFRVRFNNVSADTLPVADTFL